MIIGSKNFPEMTVEEIVQEWKHWDDIITNANSWGAALSEAAEFRRDCAVELAKRGVKVE